MKITQVGYFGGKFLCLTEGEWPVKEKQSCGGQPNCCAEMGHGRCRVLEYNESLSSALSKAVEFEDQEVAKLLVEYLYFDAQKPWGNGIYSIPEAEISVVELCDQIDCVVKESILHKRVARIVSTPKEEVKDKRYVMDELIDEHLRRFSENNVFKSSAEHFLSTGKPSGSFRSSLHAMMEDYSRKSPKEESQEELTRYKLLTEWNNDHEDKAEFLDWLLENFNITRKVK